MVIAPDRIDLSDHDTELLAQVSRLMSWKPPTDSPMRVLLDE
jgi:hypothetical protein